MKAHDRRQGNSERIAATVAILLLLLIGLFYADRPPAPPLQSPMPPLIHLLDGPPPLMPPPLPALPPEEASPPAVVPEPSAPAEPVPLSSPPVPTSPPPAAEIAPLVPQIRPSAIVRDHRTPRHRSKPVAAEQAAWIEAEPCSTWQAEAAWCSSCGAQPGQSAH